MIFLLTTAFAHTFATKKDMDGRIVAAFWVDKRVGRRHGQFHLCRKMNGTTNFLILQNGRRTAVTRHPKEILRSLPAELIKSIEVITSPGAKYDAEGIGGIINIVMQRRYEGHLTNLNGAVNNMGFVTGLSTTTKIGRFSIDGYMNYNRILTPTGSNASHTYNYASDSRAYQQTASRHKSRGSTEFANINASYEIDTLQLLTLSPLLC